jgi:2-polyprenyl-3-methyl-5-hydroxy-6-metoxy-1,4-benzoquinol methylase
MTYVRALELTDEVRRNAESGAQRHGVPAAVHEGDFILAHCVKSMGLSLEGAVHGYFNGGDHDARQLAEVVAQFNWGDRRLKVMEFAAGYGRVTRHLPRYFPKHEVFASDIHAEAVKFMSQQLGVPSLQSSEVPEKIDLKARYDVISVMSLFSHLPDSSFGRFLKALTDHLSPAGIMMFSAHGDAAMKLYPHLRENYDPATGFGYRAESEQHDLNTAEYGMAVSTPNYVIRQIERHTKCQLVGFRSGVWFGLQDEWVIRNAA